MTEQIVLIGLDGATWDLLRGWFEDDALPNLRRVYDDGFSGTLKSTIPANTSPAVQSLYTGCDPGTLGLFGFQKPDGTTISLQDVTVPKLWTVLDEHDHSSCIVNVRTTFPPDPVNGVMLSGDPMPGEDSDYAYPSELKEEVAGFRCQEKDDRMHKELVPPYDHSEEILQHAVDIFTHRFGTFRELAADGDYDFLMYWVGETDFLQHRLWNNKDDLKAFYEVLDQKLGEFLAEFDGTAIFLSDHGFEGPPTTVFYLNEWLRRKGYLTVPGGRIGARLLSIGQDFARKYVNKDLLMRILYFRQQRESDAASDTDADEHAVGINKPHLQIPGIGSGSTAQLATNCGIEVRTGENRQSVADEIKSKLASLTDDQGTPVMKETLHRGEIYEEGPYFQEIPDVLFQASEHITVNPYLSANVFETIPSDNRSGRGRHVYARNGVIFGTGPAVESARGIEADITDVTPTILNLFGLPIAETMTGSVLTEICPDNGESVRVDSYLGEAETTRIDEEEQEEMEEWLEDMGYI